MEDARRLGVRTLCSNTTENGAGWSTSPLTAAAAAGGYVTTHVSACATMIPAGHVGNSKVVRMNVQVLSHQKRHRRSRSR